MSAPAGPNGPVYPFGKVPGGLYIYRDEGFRQ